MCEFCEIKKWSFSLYMTAAISCTISYKCENVFMGGPKEIQISFQDVGNYSTVQWRPLLYDFSNIGSAKIDKCQCWLLFILDG